MCVPPFFSTRPSDRKQIWPTYSGRYGTHPQLKKLTHPTPGGSHGVFRGSKNQKSGKCHELPRKSIHFFNPPPRMERGRGRREGGDREEKRERETGREGGARAKPGNQLVIL